MAAEHLRIFHFEELAVFSFCTDEASLGPLGLLLCPRGGGEAEGLGAELPSQRGQPALPGDTKRARACLGHCFPKTKWKTSGKKMVLHRFSLQNYCSAGRAATSCLAGTHCWHSSSLPMFLTLNLAALGKHPARRQWKCQGSAHGRGQSPLLVAQREGVIRRQTATCARCPAKCQRCRDGHWLSPLPRGTLCTCEALGCYSFKAQQVEMHGWRYEEYLKQAGTARAQCPAAAGRQDRQTPTHSQEVPGSAAKVPAKPA